MVAPILCAPGIFWLFLLENLHVFFGGVLLVDTTFLVIFWAGSEKKTQSIAFLGVIAFRRPPKWTVSHQSREIA